jgi:hypothetical protein
MDIKEVGPYEYQFTYHGGSFSGQPANDWLFIYGKKRRQ